MDKNPRMNNKLFNSILIVIVLVSNINTSCKKDEAPVDYEIFTDDRDGESYTYVKIGNQYWMRENIRYKPDAGNYWAYDNIESDVKTHGYLYDWEAAKKACPTGWHLPSKAEWTELATYLGGFNLAGGKMKMTGTSSWNTPNRDATNSSGFSALSVGNYDGNGVFDARRNLTYFWSSEVSNNIYWLSYDSGFLGETFFDSGFESASVRCIKN